MSACAWLFRGATGGVLDLSRVRLVVPGARSGRVLVAMLVEEAERRGAALSPPLTLTPGEMPATVLRPAGRPAGTIARRLAWMSALKRAPAELLSRLVVERPEDGDRRAWSALAAMLERVHEELAGELILPGEVPERAAALHGFAEQERWAAIARVQAEYAAELGRLGLHDPGLALIAALRAGTPFDPCDVLLVGVPELSAAAIAALHANLRAGGSVASLVAAAQDNAELFDALGLVRSAWTTATIPLRDEQIVFADDPADQARRALAAVAGLDANYPAHAIAIGVPDEEVSPALEREASRCGLPVRPAAGTPLARTSPAAALEAIANYLSDPTLETLLALVQRPEVEAYLRRTLVPPFRRRSAPSGKPPRTEWWLGAIEAYAAESLHRRIGGPWHTSSRNLAALLDAIVAGVHALLAEFSPGATTARPIAEWGRAALAVLSRLYAGVRCARHAPSQRLLIDAAAALRDTLAEIGEADESLSDPAPPADALQLALEMVRHRAAPGEARPEAAELLGWLELALDPSPVLIVTGMNEGAVPAGSVADAFLPDSLRRALGIVDDQRRLARDAYLLTAMSRPREHFLAICGRRREDGTPRVPSRLLMACENAAAVERVLRYADPKREPPAPVRVVPRLHPASKNHFRVRPVVERPPVESLPVRAFKEYLASPYAFYLRFVLGLEEAGPPAVEMDGLVFGALLHGVLEAFGRDGVRDSERPPQVSEFLSETLHSHAARAFGPRPPAAVRLQLAAARRRLHAFAAAQAQRRAEGWRIEHVEWKPPGAVTLDVDGVPFGVRGKIDRIEVHESTGAIAILDYKTGDSAVEPGKAHRNAEGWIDLQLPLYRHLAAALRSPRAPAGVELGYIAISADQRGASPFLIAGWDAADLIAADGAAADVVRAVRARRFESLGERPPEEGVFAALCGVGFLTRDEGGEP